MLEDKEGKEEEVVVVVVVVIVVIAVGHDGSAHPHWCCWPLFMSTFPRSSVPALPHSCTGHPLFMLHPPLFWLFWLCHLYSHN